MAAKELGVRQKGASVEELKATCLRVESKQNTLTAWLAGNARIASAVQEPQQQRTLNAWLVGNAAVAESAAAVPESAAACQALPAARKRIAVKPKWLRRKGTLAKQMEIRRALRTTPDSKQRQIRRRERSTLRFKAKRRE